ncbi:MAG TPA: VIT and VWA domain-containing protein, partial [Planctomycetaceae bacterium]|nr:VIT and VWA domain-containing protein [Planctomycetaceae bacterium]
MALLRAAERDLTPPDADRLRAIEQAALDAFLAADELTTTDLPEGGNSAAPATVESPTLPPTSPARRSKMFALLSRGILAVAATLVAAVMWLNPFGGVVSGAVPFGEVLDRLRSADTLQFQLVRTKDGASEASLVSYRAPGSVRVEQSPQRYQIATGSRWWQIDETENSVVVGDSPWFRSPRTPVDLLALLEVGVTDSTPLLQAQAVDRDVYEGRECHVYRVALATETDSSDVEVEALADAKTHELVLLRAFPAPKEQGQKAPRQRLAQLELVAVNAPVAEEKFVIAKSLSEDGRIGKVSAAQGIVVLRPALAKRWTPVCRETVLKPGDWLRVEHRGPNAVKVSLTSSVELTVGPGSLLECLTPGQARLHNGQVQVHYPQQLIADTKTSFTLLGPRQGDRVFHPGEKQLLRVDRDEKLVEVPTAPVWLTGFEGTSATESLGSLIVNLPDGRNEPLTVGYHKVSVEIRDQIARTTIEESFVNHTGGRLEGVFHFPLPQDASISGFGMWIGNDLIDADVVEKQRAREIYETILRERRDPGLLEWTSGNLFKARVFPIEPHSEKRVKIVYTQVLPLRGQRYRYSYNLRSDLLQTKPLRELLLNVTVNSALPLKSITCPSHPVRTQQGAHSAQVEFNAQEYIPTRDFEVVCELDRTQTDVVAIPHRRGDDGYLLVQLSPPGGQGNWQRELLPDGEPIKVVLLCDTSASMDNEKRKQQTEFVATVLSALGKEDRFQLAASDVGTAWAFPEPAVANEANIATARQFLDDRLSLGWTNLDRAFNDVIAKAPADAHVIYIGDGIVSSGDTDASNFIKRINLLFGAKDNGPRRTFHAIGVGNITEMIALRGIAISGGGSVRMISGEQTPAVVATELLNEIAQPGLRDLQVEFKGVKIAAVDPERL